MSTFSGVIHEFPEIRVDYFRRQPRPFLSRGVRGSGLLTLPPLACFLSHIHSDHLAGLESLKSPFVYCSAATRAMLLRLETRKARVVAAQHKLATRCQTYRHLAKLLRPLPLDTPVTLELAPGSKIRVTLIDANHCPGAVMFLFERPASDADAGSIHCFGTKAAIGNGGSSAAALYTGDVRVEAWWLDAVVRRSASLAPYVAGVRRLDTVYMDSSFTASGVEFQSKAEGIGELLRQVIRYPADTIFYVQAWTYGYEDVWLALANALGERVHVDDYKLGIFSSLRANVYTSPTAAMVAAKSAAVPSGIVHHYRDAPALVGFMYGNDEHPGCLTRNTNVRIHSCEKSNLCDVVRKSPVVRIQPIVARMPNGASIPELGIGGGDVDLEREAALELGANDLETLYKVLDDTMEEEIPRDIRLQLRARLEQVGNEGKSLDIDLKVVEKNNEAEIRDALKVLAGNIVGNQVEPTSSATSSLPKVIRFPYARHSSLLEQQELVRVLRPRDVWPCTADPFRWLVDDMSVAKLYGQYCSGTMFKYDEELKLLAGQLDAERGQWQSKASQTPLLGSSPEMDHSHGVELEDFETQRTNEPPMSSQHSISELLETECATHDGQGQCLRPEFLVSSSTTTKPLPVADPVVPTSAIQDTPVASSAVSVASQPLLPTKRSFADYSTDLYEETVPVEVASDTSVNEKSSIRSDKQQLNEDAESTANISDGSENAFEPSEDLCSAEVREASFWAMLENTFACGNNLGALSLLSASKGRPNDDRDLSRR